MKYLPLNISYATWAGLGLVLTTLVSVIIFKENINLISIFSITLIIIGVVLLNVLDQDTNCFIPIALLTLSLGTLNNPKTCRMVGLIAHAMPTFVYKFS